MSPAKKIVFVSILAAGGLVALLWWKPERPASKERKGPLTIYCAAGIKPPVEAVGREYERIYGVPIQLQYGGSGTLLSNLRVARRGDLFLAADDSYLAIARTNHLVEEVIPLARMSPVIAVRKGNPKNIRALEDLWRADIATALANPDAAAIGKITRELLQESGDWAALEKHAKVFKPTVNDVANDIKIGTVDAGIIWDATARQYPELEMVKVAILEPGEQRVSIGVLKFSQHPTTALHFARYLGARDKGLKEFARSGYQPVEGDVWAEKPAVVLYSGGVNRLAVEQTIRNFEKREGVRVDRVFNGCGILVSQIKSGQRPDAYFACDVSFMRDVSEQFLAPLDVSETAIVLLVPKGNPKSIQNLGDLTRPGLRLGVPNAQQSALGALATKIFQEAGLHDAIMANVKAQTPTADLLVNQMRTGSLDAVVVFEANTSQVRDTLDVILLNVPRAKAIQPYAIGKNSEHRQLMERLLEAIRSPESRQRFESVGFHWAQPTNAP